MNKFFTRASTGLIFAAVMLGMSYFKMGYFLLFGLISIFSTLEFLAITKSLRDEKDTSVYRRIYTVLINLTAFVLTAIIVFYEAKASLLLFLPAMLFGLFILELYAKSESPFVNIAVNLSAFVYIGIPFAMLNLIVFKEGEYYHDILYGILILIWIYDASAYVIGSKFGKRPLFKRISPNKSIEGLVGGILVLTAVGFSLSFIFKNGLTGFEWAVVSWIIAYFSATGDLIESMLKRSLNIKDSGDILPGHGGLLDRFDAFIFVIPFIALYLLVFSH